MAFASVLLQPSAAWAQSASRPDSECRCGGGLQSPPSFGPANFVFLIDGRQYDISTYRLFRSRLLAGANEPDQEIPSRAEPFFDSGMYQIIPEGEILVGKGYNYGATIFVSPEPFSDGDAGGFRAESEYVDEVPPVVGDGLRVTTRVFTNDCGSKALYFEDGGTSDDFSGNINRLPVLVRIRSLERDLSFTTFSTTFGFTNNVNENVIAYNPFTGRCIGDRGLESLEFEQGEQVEVELTVYDYAGNAAEPVTQTIEWPIAQDSGGCTVGPLSPGAASLGFVLLMLVLLRRRARGPATGTT